MAGLSNRRPAGAPDRADTVAGTAPAQIRVADARTAVTALYQVHAVGLIRLAVIMTGDRQAAEDVVQEAFCGLFRRWAHLADQDKALSYVRSCALNGCRSELRRRIRTERRATRDTVPADAESAEYAALAALGRLLEGDR